MPIYPATGISSDFVQAKQCFGSLQKTLVELEEEIAKKANSLYIDEVSISFKEYDTSYFFTLE